MKSFPKNKPYRNKKAREWYRTQPCDYCGKSGEGMVTGHHEALNGRGTGTKCSDDEQIPLCFTCHRLRHDIGRRSFYGVANWRYKVMYYHRLVHKYLTGK